MSLLSRFLLASSLLAAGVTAATPYLTDPVGAIKVEIPARSDMLITLPLHEQPVYRGMVEAGVDNVLTIASELPGELAWADGHWASSEDSPPIYYVLFTSGWLEGFHAAIIGNGSNTLVLDLPAGGLETYALADAGIEIIPYWTLERCFEGRELVSASTSIGGADVATEIHLYDGQPGINKAASRVYFYYSGDDFGGPGWRMRGAPFTAIQNSTVLGPDTAFVFRNLRDVPVVLETGGAVRMAASNLVLLRQPVANDSRLGLSSAIPLTLSQSALRESDGFRGTNIISGIGGDELLVFDPATGGLNRAADASFYYYTGESFGGPGWRRKGGGFANIVDDVAVFAPGVGFVVRQSGSDGSEPAFWTFLPPYLQ